MSRQPMDLEEIRVRVNADVSSLISAMLRLCDEVELANAERERAVQVARENEFLRRGIEAYRKGHCEAWNDSCDVCRWEEEREAREMGEAR